MTVDMSDDLLSWLYVLMLLRLSYVYSKPDKSKHKVDMSDDLSSWLYVLMLLRLSHVYSKPDKSNHKVDKET
jgi:hypothetical protein